MEKNQTIQKNSFSIHTSVYEGPFELVLELIEKRRLLVNDIALASITDDFIQYVHNKEKFPVDEITSFIGIASTLLLIKSKSLLPNLELTEEETEDVEDFKQRLYVYEQARNASRVLGHIFGKSILISQGEKPVEPLFSPSRDLSLEAMSKALLTALSERNFDKEILPEARVRSTISLREAMDNLSMRVQGAITISFLEFSGHGTKEKVDVIVTFLALLELVKQGGVEVSQYDKHGDIRITNATSDAVPRYEI
ncbi:Segregation and condensation protein A [hydrothermal vent metagenome]|uniref:Segregation and condensation protein A n=1 Tax=hydrothermal vent metagenome TaxID=652676 RepID=A0A3B0VMS5_9ZZZZ